MPGPSTPIFLNVHRDVIVRPQLRLSRNKHNLSPHREKRPFTFPTLLQQAKLAFMVAILYWGTRPCSSAILMHLFKFPLLWMVVTGSHQQGNWPVPSVARLLQPRGPGTLRPKAEPAAQAGTKIPVQRTLFTAIRFSTCLKRIKMLLLRKENEGL